MSEKKLKFIFFANILKKLKKKTKNLKYFKHPKFINPKIPKLFNIKITKLQNLETQ